MIPFNRVVLPEANLAYLNEAARTGKIAGEQGFTKRCQGLLEQKLGVKKALLTTSCTHALEMAAILLDIQEGDEVIVPAFTFVSTASAFVMRGAHIVFCDIRPDTLNLDETKLEELITPRTVAIVPVHYAGVACEMDEIMRIAGNHNVRVVEDNAHGLFGRYKGRLLGTIGDLATQSFHETKNLTCGEGGALLINHERFAERAEIIREKGTNRARFFRGQIDKYSWVDLGSSYVMSDLLAALLLGQLESADSIQRRRQVVWARYDRELPQWALKRLVYRPHVPPECEHPAHMYYLLMPSLTARTAFITHLRARGVQATFHYGPLNKSDYGSRFGGECPIAEAVADRIVRLPLYASLTESEQDQVIQAVKSFQS